MRARLDSAPSAFGVVLGTKDGERCELHLSFEVAVDAGVLNQGVFERRREQCTCNTVRLCSPASMSCVGGVRCVRYWRRARGGC